MKIQDVLGRISVVIITAMLITITGCTTQRPADDGELDAIDQGDTVRIDEADDEETDEMIEEDVSDGEDSTVREEDAYTEGGDGTVEIVYADDYADNLGDEDESDDSLAAINAIEGRMAISCLDIGQDFFDDLADRNRTEQTDDVYFDDLYVDTESGNCMLAYSYMHEGRYYWVVTDLTADGDTDPAYSDECMPDYDVEADEMTYCTAEQIGEHQEKFAAYVDEHSAPSYGNNTVISQATRAVDKTCHQTVERYADQYIYPMTGYSQLIYYDVRRAPQTNHCVLGYSYTTDKTLTYKIVDADATQDKQRLLWTDSCTPKAGNTCAQDRRDAMHTLYGAEIEKYTINDSVAE